MDKGTVSWFSGFADIDEMAEARGYEISEGSPVKLIDISDILAAGKMDKGLNEDNPDWECLPLISLWQYQVNDILDLLDQHGIKREDSWLEGFDGRLSQAVFDENDRLLEVLLATGGDDGFLLQLMLGTDNSKAATVSEGMAIQGFFRAVREWEGNAGRLVFIEENGRVTAAIHQYFAPEGEEETIGMVHTVSDVGEEFASDFLDACRAAEEMSAIQQNIVWKVELS